MRTPGIPGITSIECPSCGHRLEDYDAPVTVYGRLRLTARCHACLTEQVIDVDHGPRETWVVPFSHKKWGRVA